MADSPDPVAAYLAGVSEQERAATMGPWEARDSEDHWQLFGAVTPGMHPVQLIKAPKRDTPYAEYWPTAADAAFIVTARTAVLRLLAAVEAVLAVHHPRTDRNYTGCVACGQLYPCSTIRAIAAELPGEGDGG